MENDKNIQIQCRKLVLDFYGAQLGTHGRLIIGFSVIVFTLAGIRNAIHSILFHQLLILYSAIFLTMFGFLYLLFRHLAYGQLCGAVMFTAWKPEFLEEPCNDLIAKFLDEVKMDVETHREKIVLIVPTDWFIDKQRYGAIFCAILSFIVTCLFYLTLG